MSREGVAIAMSLTSFYLVVPDKNWCVHVISCARKFILKLYYTKLRSKKAASNTVSTYLGKQIYSKQPCWYCLSVSLKNPFKLLYLTHIVKWFLFYVTVFSKLFLAKRSKKLRETIDFYRVRQVWSSRHSDRDAPARFSSFCIAS